MQPFRPQHLHKDTQEIVRETVADLERLQRRQADLNRTITQSRARLTHTREILKAMDAALARLNINV